MPDRWLRDFVLVFMLGLAANTVGAAFVKPPSYMDAAYYFGGALQLARGQGFSEPYLWNYLSAAGALPQPSHLYWMPLTSIVAAPFVALAEAISGGAWANPALYRAAQIPFVVLASALPLLSYSVAAQTTGLRRHALAAALMTLFGGFYFVFWANVDAFALFGLTAGGALLAGARSARPGAPQGQAVIAGLLAGLAHLARADGVLVVICLILFSLVRGRRIASAALRTALLIALGYGLVVAPWLARNYLAAGSLLAPNGARALWLTNYNELFTFEFQTLTLERYLASGWSAIAEGKWRALSTNFGNLLAAQSAIAVFPLMLIGFWRLRRRAVFQLAGFYGLALFGAMTLVFTFPGVNGGYFHSGAALLPFIYPAGLVGLDACVEAAAGRLPHWQPARSRPVFTALLVALVAGLTGLVFHMRAVAGDWRRERPPADAFYAEVGAWLDDQCAGAGCAAPVAVNNPPAFHFYTERPAIVVPDGDVGDLLAAMGAYESEWAVIDANHPDGLAGLYAAPASEPRFRMHAAFTDGAGRAVYLLQVVRP